MSIRLLRWMAQAWTVWIILFIIYILAGMAIELLAGMGFAARNTSLWAILHPEWAGRLVELALLVFVHTLSRSARRALQRRERPPVAGNLASPRDSGS